MLSPSNLAYVAWKEQIFLHVLLQNAFYSSHFDDHVSAFITTDKDLP
jgi:hypothetical protein